jgi:alkylation response protein AidB-like acyl-CoA dehydrogenase
MQQEDVFLYPRSRLKETDLTLASGIQDWAEKEVVSKRLEHQEDYDLLLKPALQKLMVDIGLQSVLWPEKMGGAGDNQTGSAYTVAAALEQVGRADTGIGFLASHVLALQASVAMEGRLNEKLCKDLAPVFGEGKEPAVVSFVLTAYGEEEGVPEWRGKCLQVRASLTGDEWELNGTGVRPTCSGSDADLYAVLCAVEDEDEPALILVKGEAEGLTRGAAFKKTGLAASLNADIGFDNVKVAPEMYAWAGSDSVRHLLSWFYLGLGATAVGSLLAAYEIIKEWGDNRVIKGTGHVFKENPLTASLMADAAHDTAVGRLLIYNLAEILSDPEAYGGAGSEGVFATASLIVHRIYRLAEDTLNHIMELMASAGYAKEWQLERYWRDIKTIQCHIGACELAKMDSARWFFKCETL